MLFRTASVSLAYAHERRMRAVQKPMRRRATEWRAPSNESLQRLADTLEHRVEHLGREPAGVRVVARTVIAVGEHESDRQLVQPGVDERIASCRPHRQRAQHLVVRALAQRHDGLELGHYGDLGL